VHSTSIVIYLVLILSILLVTSSVVAILATKHDSNLATTGTASNLSSTSAEARDSNIEISTLRAERFHDSNELFPLISSTTNASGTGGNFTPRQYHAI